MWGWHGEERWEGLREWVGRLGRSVLRPYGSYSRTGRGWNEIGAGGEV
jgi:hypothetical protein